MSIVDLLIAVFVICVCLWAVQRLTSAFSVPEPIATTLLVIVVVVALLWFLGQVHLSPFR
jgi:predicted PurR-regulated permease PerM